MRWSFSSKSSKYHKSQTVRAKKLTFIPWNMSDVTCHMLCVICHISHVPSYFFFYKVVKLMGVWYVINGAYPVYAALQTPLWWKHSFSRLNVRLMVSYWVCVSKAVQEPGGGLLKQGLPIIFNRPCVARAAVQTPLGKFSRHFWNICTIKSFLMKKFKRCDASELHKISMKYFSKRNF